MDKIQQQKNLESVSIVVVRTERLASVDDILSNRDMDVFHSGSDKWVAFVPYDEALSRVTTRFAVIITTPLAPMNDDCIQCLLEPMIKTDGITATRGAVIAQPDVPHYDAFRYEQESHDPLSIVGFQMKAWEKHPLGASGSHGVRWLSRLQQEGQIARVAAAQVVGFPTQTNGSLEDIFRQHWSNYPISVGNAFRMAVQETLQDWEAIRDMNVPDPAPSYVRAALVRTAENFGKTEIGRIVRGS